MSVGWHIILISGRTLDKPGQHAKDSEHLHAQHVEGTHGGEDNGRCVRSKHQILSGDAIA